MIWEMWQETIRIISRFVTQYECFDMDFDIIQPGGLVLGTGILTVVDIAEKD